MFVTLCRAKYVIEKKNEYNNLNIRNINYYFTEVLV